jgi:hypothetical protein
VRIWERGEGRKREGRIVQERHAGTLVAGCYGTYGTGLALERGGARADVDVDGWDGFMS